MLLCDMFAAKRPVHKNSISSTSPRVRRRGGFTLLEVMIATAVTLLMMVALAQIFKVIGDSMKQGRAVLELNNRLRGVVHRIRTDLNNLTAIPQPPADPSTATGYLKVFDGSLTDFSTTQVSLAQSRYGDVDDILMATVQSGDVWFTGKVPAYILAGRPPVATNPADFQLVSIASQHAEVAFFTQPLVTNVGNPNRDPRYFLTNSGLGAVAFQDTDGFPGFPDAFRLHYRVLLIRPDLNLSTGVLPSGLDGNGSYWTACSPVPGQPSPLCDMASVHQQCDLSVRRIYDPSTAAFDFVAANNLEDLMDPANRFAHVPVPIPNTRSTTMPLLALGTRLDIFAPGPGNPNNNAVDPTGTLTAAPPSGNTPFRVGSGFLHPAFVLLDARAGEDVLASDILAFDIKAFDPGVPLLGGTGGDGVNGTAGDDDGDGTNDEADELGWAGSDDLVLSPNDPGYALAIASGGTTVGNGEYVDLAWARKLAAHGGAITATSNVWSPFSGYSLSNFSPDGQLNDYTDTLFNSGNVMLSGSGNNTVTMVLQPCYDTWTSRFEGDGILQAQLAGGAGIARINGAVALYPGFSGSDAANVIPPWRNNAGTPIIDASTDGVDNNAPPIDALGLGVDDVTEKETSAPFPTTLRGLKVTVRMEDPLSRQVKQMSAGKEFVTQ